MEGHNYNPKRTVLILMPGMPRGGTEISLLNFLSIMDFSKYDVTLLLIERAGELLASIPQMVHIQTVHFDSEKYLSIARQRNRPSWLYRQLVKIGAKTNLYALPPYGYKKALRHCSVPDCAYDLAIDYHGYGSFCTPLLVEKVHAKRKARVIHGDNLHGMKTLVRWLSGLNVILDVSETCRRAVCQTFPKLAARHYILPNIVDDVSIRKKAAMNVSLNGNTAKGFLLCTVGRMEYEKGYDIAVQTAKILKEKHQAFTWIFVGDGSERRNIEKSIEANNLNEDIILTGMQSNPYPYIRMADMYVQPSRNEGFGLTVEEAQIIGTPVVASDLPAIREHFSDDQSGILVSPSAETFAKIIANCMQDKQLLLKWRNYLKTRSMDNTPYQLVNKCLNEILE